MELNKVKSSLKYVFLFLIICDLAYTFAENYYNTSVDGDIAAIVCPGKEYSKVLQDPLGLNVILKDQKYAATNRFFLHQSMVTYFNNVPIWLQKITDPISSVYLAMAFFRTFLQALMILFLAFMIGGMNKEKITWAIVTALVVTPFFQIEGFRSFMGLTYDSITYTFSYSMPLVLFLAYVYPFYRNYFSKDNLPLNLPQHVLLILLAFPIALGGPLSGPMVMILCAISLIAIVYRNAKFNGLSFWKAIFKIPKPIIFHFSFIILLSLYSFYIGRNNIENDWVKMALIDRFKLLPQGFIFIFFQKLGLPIILVGTLAFYFIIKRMKTDEGRKIISIVNYVAIGCVVYIFLLPFGGYRPYRPLIIRFDTFSPVTLAMIFCYAITAVFLLQRLKNKHLKMLCAFLVLVFLIFTNADKIKLSGNTCEREAMQTLVDSKDSVIYLGGNCTLMAWVPFKNPDDSRVCCKVLRRWNILKEDKLYIQQK